MILRHRREDRFSEVVSEWSDRTAVLIAGGPSLTREQVARVAVAHEQELVGVIAVNDAYLWAPWADVNYFADSRWWEWQTNGRDLRNGQSVAKPLLGLTAEQVREAFAMFLGQKCSIEHSGANITDPAVHILRNLTFPNHGVGISRDPRFLVTGRNSGFQALNLALLSGASRILLLGYDAHPGNDQRHWFGEHPVASSPQVYEEMRKAFSAAEAAIAATGVEVVNCSPGSQLNSFPKRALEEVL